MAVDKNSNIVDIALVADDFNILVQALSVAGLVDTVQNATNITVFAPTDAAFTSLAVQLGYHGDQSDEDALFSYITETLAALDPNGDPIPLLTDILTYHVSQGAQSTVFGAIGTLQGATFAANGMVLVDNDPEAKNPNIVAKIDASNGVVQMIDNVLLPIETPIGLAFATMIDVRLGDNLLHSDFEDNALNNTGYVDVANSSVALAGWNTTVGSANDRVFVFESEVGYGNGDGNAVVELYKGTGLSQSVTLGEAASGSSESAGRGRMAPGVPGVFGRGHTFANFNRCRTQHA